MQQVVKMQVKAELEEVKRDLKQLKSKLMMTNSKTTRKTVEESS